MIGRTLSHYKILSKLGEGAMGEVYLAEDTKLGRKVALKIPPAELSADPGRLERYEREARAVAALRRIGSWFSEQRGLEPRMGPWQALVRGLGTGGAV